MLSLSIFLLLLSTRIKSFILYNIAISILSFSTNLILSTLVGFAKAFSIRIPKGIALGISISGLLSSFIILISEKLGISYEYNFLVLFFIFIP